MLRIGLRACGCAPRPHLPHETRKALQDFWPLSERAHEGIDPTWFFGPCRAVLRQSCGVAAPALKRTLCTPPRMRDYDRSAGFARPPGNLTMCFTGRPQTSILNAGATTVVPGP